MNLRAGHVGNLFSIILVVLGLLVCAVAGSVIATCLSAIPLLLSGSDLPGFPELANEAMQTRLWMMVAEIVRCIACLGVVALMLVHFDGRPFRFAAVGITRKPNPGLMILAGFSVTSALILGAEGVASVRGVESSIPRLATVLPVIGVGGLAVLAVGALVNAFWQEVAFRGYVQDRLQRSYGVLPGIFLCSVIFVVLHGLVRPVSVEEIITGTIFFCLVGWLYFVSGSIALATALHATGNFYLRLSGELDLALPQHFDRGLVYSVGLVAALVLFRNRLFPHTRPGKERMASET